MSEKIVLYGKKFIFRKIFPKNCQKEQIWDKILEIFTNMPHKSNFMPKSRNFGKICKNMLDLVGLILLEIFWSAKEISICSKVCNLKNMQKDILPFSIYVLRFITKCMETDVQDKLFITRTSKTALFGVCFFSLFQMLSPKYSFPYSFAQPPTFSSERR